MFSFIIPVIQQYHVIHIVLSEGLQIYGTFKFFTLIQIISSHTHTKRDTSSEIDPYAAYYEYYANQQAAIDELPDAIPSNEIYEKQGFATTMQDVFGSEAGVR